MFPAAVAIVAAAALVAPTGSSTAASADGAASAKTPTAFAFKAAGFGTRVQGGQLPAGSDTTAFQTIGCTNTAGIDRENHEANANLGLVNASGVKSRVWTEQKDGVTSSYSRHSVANIVLGDPDVGHLEINAVSARARAFHDASGYHTETKIHIASIMFTPSGGHAQGLEIPTPNQPIVIPGLAKINIGDSTGKTSSTSAYAAANAIDIKVLPTDTRVRIAHSAAEVTGGVKSGIFKGYAAGTQVKAAADHISSGPTPLMLMPCQGTQGKTLTKGAAHLNLADAVVVRGVDTEQWSTGDVLTSEIREEASIAKINLGNGQLIINGVIGRAHVAMTPLGLTSDAKGTSILEIIVNGDVRHFPRTGVIEIPGLVRIEDSVVKRTKHGISVTALQLKLLDGTGAVVNLGVARASIQRSGI
jgi:hypothetical protein